jgi:uncharacterized protein YndB with AHSA1/START domain
VPRINRSRVIAAPPERVWAVVSDPHHLPRWWPRAVRVEDVREDSGQAMKWTTVLGTESGTRVRADYSRIDPEREHSFAWTQDLEGTPFERILRSAEVVIRVEPEGEGSRVTVDSSERLRGLSRLGSPLMRAAARRRVDEALENLDRVVGDPS